MPPENQPEPKPDSVHPAAEHVADAHHLMKALQDRIGKHPELSQAITNLEMALSILTVKTAGFL